MVRDNLTKKRVIIIVLVLVVVFSFIGFKISINGKNKQFNYAVTTLQNVATNEDAGYIAISFNDKGFDNLNELQIYDNGATYFIQDTKSDDINFKLESVCDNNVEYVKTNYSDGYEILNSNDCSSRDLNIHNAIGSQYGFSGIELSTLSSNDFTIKNSGNKSILTAKKEKLSSNIFLGNFVENDNVEVKDLVITVEDKKVTIDIKVNHPSYENLEISLTISEGVVIELPEYK